MRNPSGLLLLVVLMVVVYAVMVLPQRRQQKARQAMINNLGPGARVLTAGGLYATVIEVRDDGILARIGVGEGLNVELDARSVVRLVQAAPAETPAHSGTDSEA